MAQIQIDPVSGLPIIPREWLTVQTSPGSWNEAMNREVYLQNVGFTPEAFAALEQAGFGNGSNYQWGYGSGADGLGNWQQDPSIWGDLTNPTLNSVMKKTADKEGTLYTYTLDANGNYVPSATGQTEHWDTNNGSMNKKALMAAAALLGGGLGANAMFGTGAFNAIPATGLGDLGVNALLGSALTDGAGVGLAGGAGAAGGASATGGGATGFTGTGGGPTAGLMNNEALLLGADPSVLAAAGLDPAMTSAVMGGAAGYGTGAPTIGAALNGAFGASGASLANAVTAGMTGIGTTLANSGGLAAATWPTSTTTTTPAPPVDTTTPPGGPPPKAPGTSGGFQVPTDLAGWLKLLGPVIGGGLLYKEARDANGQPQGYGPSLAGITGLMNTPRTQPTFNTSLSGLLPPQRKYY